MDNQDQRIVFTKPVEEAFSITPDRQGLLIDWKEITATAKRVQGMPPGMPVHQQDMVVLAVYLAYLVGVDHARILKGID